MRACAQALRFGGSLLVLALAGGAAQAQVAADQSTVSPAPAPSPDTAAPADKAIADIVVTAQRRSESLQRTSIVLDVVSAQDLARNSVTQIQALTSILPGVQIGTAGPSLQVYIRGVGDFGATANTNSSVALNIDNVYVGRSQSVPSEFYDIERVEALKGPQGTLYGRNASGGALNVLTRRPVIGSFSGTVSGEYANRDSLTLEAGINIPISATLAARVSGIFVRKGGYTSEGYGDDRHGSGRLKLLWQPNAAVSLLLNASISHVGGKGNGYVLVNKTGVPGQNGFTDFTDPIVQPYLAAQIPSSFPPIPGIVVSPGVNDGFQDNKFRNVSAELNADLGFAKLTVLPAYRYASLRDTNVQVVKYQLGIGFGPYPARPETSKQTSLEIRLANETPSFKWVIGGYFYNEDQFSQYLTNDGLRANTAAIFTLGTRSYAAFGQATYSITPKLRVIGGLRYTTDRRAIDGVKLNVAPAFPSCGLPPFSAPLPAGTICPIESFTGNRTFKNLSWKAGAEYDLAPQSLLFATVSSGFKSGGFNTLIAPTAPAGSTAAFGFEPEKLTAYELGIKNRFLDNRVQLNVEAFYWNYRDHQEPYVAISGSGNPSLAIANAGKARMYGGSVNLIVKPWRNGTFAGNVEYADTKYNDFEILQPAAFVLPGSTGCPLQASGQVGAFGPVARINCSGMELTRAPKWLGSASYTHIFPLTGGSSVEAQGAMEFASSRWLTADFVSNSRAPAYQTFNFNLTWVAPNQALRVIAFVRNITNAVAYQGGLQAPYQPNVIVANLAPSRTFGVRASLNF